jgi:carbonic anhydrase
MRHRCFPVALALALAFPMAAQEADALWKMLLAENLKYVAGSLEYTKLIDQRKDHVDEQEPHVLVLSCADSRVPPELIFHQSVGDLFVVREAGNVADEFSIASIEYAVSHGWTKLIVVLGHENCGAVKEAMKLDDPPTPSLVALVHRLRRSFVSGQVDLPHAVRDNAKASAAYLTAESPLIRKAVMDGKVKIIPAYYELGSGRVTAVE